MMKAAVFFACILGFVFGLPNPENNSKVHPAYQKDIRASSSIDARIINGEVAERDQFPYQISLKWGLLIISPSHICGGSILSESTIVTAGHCPQDYGTHSIDAGILHRGEKTEFTQNREVSKIISHPNWPGGSSVSPWDISILKLKTPLTFTSSVQPINLPESGATYTGQAVLSGWGKTSPSSSAQLPTTLHFANKELITNDECSDDLIDVMGSAGPLDDSMICTSGAKKISACNGDSGGPLAQDNTLIGIVSWGLNPCGTANAPSVFTKVSDYIDWIDSNK